MTNAQKIIKYIALALAACLIINIISAIIFGISVVAGIFNLKKANITNLENLEAISANFDSVQASSLKLELQYANLKIQNGDVFKVESNSSNIKCIQKNDKIVIEENSNWLSRNKPTDIVIIIPTNMNFDEVKIDSGAGTVEIEELNSKVLNFNIGAGKVNIEKLNVFDKAHIEGGTGSVCINDGKISNMNLDIGVGKFILKSQLVGENSIDAGIGNIEVDLIDGIENYTVKVEKGIGKINFNGRQVSNNTQYGLGENYIKINGGIGNIDINM